MSSSTHFLRNIQNELRRIDGNMASFQKYCSSENAPGNLSAVGKNLKDPLAHWNACLSDFRRCAEDLENINEGILQDAPETFLQLLRAAYSLFAQTCDRRGKRSACDAASLILQDLLDQDSGFCEWKKTETPAWKATTKESLDRARRQWSNFLDGLNVVFFPECPGPPTTLFKRVHPLPNLDGGDTMSTGWVGDAYTLSWTENPDGDHQCSTSTASSLCQIVLTKAAVFKSYEEYDQTTGTVESDAKPLCSTLVPLHSSTGPGTPLNYLWVDRDGNEIPPPALTFC
jgi:hypothetical protein